MAVVTITLSPTTMGDDHATPGTSTFQAMFLSLLHSLGSLDSLLSAAEPGPRNCGQSSAHTAAGAPTRQPSANNRRSNTAESPRGLCGERMGKCTRDGMRE